MTNSRIGNAYKINNHALYAKPHRVAIPVCQSLLLLISLTVTGLGLSWVIDGSGGDIEDQGGVSQGTRNFIRFLIWVVVPASLSIISGLNLSARYHRTATPGYTQLASIVTLVCWVVYIFMSALAAHGKHIQVVDLTYSIIAAPGFILAFICLVFATLAAKQDKKKQRAEERAVVLNEEDGLPRSEPIARQSTQVPLKAFDEVNVR